MKKRPPRQSREPDKSRDQDKVASAIEKQEYVTLDEYLTREAVTYPMIPGHQRDMNQRYALVRLHDGAFAILAHNINCFYARDERTRIVETCRTPEQVQGGMKRFAEMKRAALYGWDQAKEPQTERQPQQEQPFRSYGMSR